MKIIFVTSSLLPYRVDWLDELGKRADIKVMYLEETNPSRNAKWAKKRPTYCSFSLMKGIKLPLIGKISFGFISEIRRNYGAYDIVILDGYGFLTQVLNILYLNKRGIRYFVNIDGFLPDEGRSTLKKIIKPAFIRSIPYFLCGCQAAAKQLVNYGVSSSRIINHQFTSLREEDILREVVSQETKRALKVKLGIKEDKAILTVGRFSYLGGYGKGYDVLLRAAKQQTRRIGWYIVGGEPTKEFIKLKDEAGLDNVHFIKFLIDEELKEYYKACDMFVLMTIGDVWGLVVNEAMANALPVITTTMCSAGLELIEDGVNGKIINVGDNDELSEQVTEIFSSPQLLQSMARNSLMKIKKYTIENMANIHMSTFENELAKKDRDKVR